MGMRMPQADLYFGQYTDAQLAQRAQQVHDAIVLNVLTFPDLPITMVAFLADIVTYRGAMAAALKGSKAQTAAKATAKTTVEYDMRQLALYVNSLILANMSGTGSEVINNNGTSILVKSGFAFSQDPTPQANATSGVPAPIVRKFLSRDPGTLYILLQQQQKRKRVVIDTSLGRKMYQVRYRTSEIPGTVPVPAGPWIYNAYSSGRITVQDLTSGTQYDFQVAAVGGRNVQQNEARPLIYTQIRSAVII